jgi:N-acetylglucosamine kinase-like BadF-type ATPase
VRSSGHAAVAKRAASLVREAMAAAGASGPATALCCGLTGAGRERERAAIEEALHTENLARAVRVVTDAEVARFDAFGMEPGILLIAGTGSIALAHGPSGTTARAGGWGRVLGDEGSAWAIGLHALVAVLRAHDGRGPPTALHDALLDMARVEPPESLVRWVERAGKSGVAALAPRVVELAGQDAVAASIVDQAVRDLALHVRALAGRVGPWPGAIPVGLAGGLLATGRPLRDRVAASIGELVSGSRVLDRDIDGARGAAAIAHTLATKGARGSPHPAGQGEPRNRG